LFDADIHHHHHYHFSYSYRGQFYRQHINSFLSSSSAIQCQIISAQTTMSTGGVFRVPLYFLQLSADSSIALRMMRIDQLGTTINYIECNKLEHLMQVLEFNNISDLIEKHLQSYITPLFNLESLQTQSKLIDVEEINRKFDIAHYDLHNITMNIDSALKASLKPLATVKRDGVSKNINATTVVPGDLLLLASGSAIPADCLVNEGQIEVDQSALTGESLPVTMYKGSSCKMGSNVVRGEVEGTVETTGSNTFFGKTATLLQGSSELGNLQKVLMRIVIVLVILSLTFSGIVFAYLLASDVNTQEAVSFTVVLIVASIPVAIEIVCTTTLALGSKELAKHGAIVTRLAAIEDMAGMNMLCSDKTGTLTMNKMVIQEETPVYIKGETNIAYYAMQRWQRSGRNLHVTH